MKKIQINKQEVQFLTSTQTVSGKDVLEIIIDGQSFFYRSPEMVGDEISYISHKKIDDKLTQNAPRLRSKVSEDEQGLVFVTAPQLGNMGGQTFEMDSNMSRSKRSGGDADEGAMVSPMPGKVLKILCANGQEVKKGDSLLILEAMKMEHTIKASQDGVVEKVFYQEGDLVEGGVELVHLVKAES